MYIQKTILYCFPAICWVYNAGFIFSSFVSFVFWGGAVMRAYESVRRSTTVVRPSQLRVRMFLKGPPARLSQTHCVQDATTDDVDRMGGNCAICWGDMAPHGGSAASGKSLPCSHAFHEACLVQWLHQCHGCVMARIYV